MAASLSLRRGLESSPDAIDYPIDIAAIYGPSSDAAYQHVNALTAYLAQRPDNLDGWMLLGYVRFGLGDAAGAAEAFDRAATLAPYDSLVHMLRESALRIWTAAPLEGPGGAESLGQGQLAPMYPTAP